jgi:signal transduction histidine kinase
MRERAREIGGQLRVRSTPGCGTTVSVLVPYRSR